MNTVFNIKDYGAVGDGITNDTNAVQRALDDAAKCRGAVSVPPGTYSVGELKLGAGVSLTGTAAWSFRSYGSSVFVLNDDNATCLLDITGAFGCAINGMSLNGNGLGKNIHGIKLSWDKYNGGSEEDTPAIDNCRIGNFTGDGVHLYHIWCFSVRHSMLFGNGGAGLFLDGWDAFILDNWFTANGNCGIRCGECCAALTLTGNRVEWNTTAGFHFTRGDGVNITGNFFDRTGGPAVLLGTCDGGMTNTTITGNVFRRNGRPGTKPFANPHDNCHVRITNSSGVTLTGNSCRFGRDDGDQGVFSPDYNFVISDSSFCIIKDNTVHEGCLKESVISDDSNQEVVIKDNIGETAKPW